MKKIIVFVFFIIFLVGCSDLFEPRYFKSIGNWGVMTYPGDTPPINPFEKNNRNYIIIIEKEK